MTFEYNQLVTFPIGAKNHMQWMRENEYNEYLSIQFGTGKNAYTPRLIGENQMLFVAV